MAAAVEPPTCLNAKWEVRALRELIVMPLLQIHGHTTSKQQLLWLLGRPMPTDSHVVGGRYNSFGLTMEKIECGLS